MINRAGIFKALLSRHPAKTGQKGGNPTWNPFLIPFRSEQSARREEMNLVRVAGDWALSPVLVTGGGWRCDYPVIVVGAAFSVPCVKPPDLLPGFSFTIR